MKIVYLQSAVQDIGWFRPYYKSVFPSGSERAGKQLKSIQALLAENPYIGHPSEGFDDVRELVITKTPFTLIYRVTSQQIEILRLWDNRQGGV